MAMNNGNVPGIGIAKHAEAVFDRQYEINTVGMQLRALVHEKATLMVELERVNRQIREAVYELRKKSVKPLDVL